MFRRLLTLLAFVSLGCTQIPNEMTSKQFDFNAHALSFANFGDRYEEGKFNAELAIRMFGREAVCQPNLNDCVIDPNIELFIEDVNSTLAAGHSEGFAVLAQLFASGKLRSTDFGAETPSRLTLSNNQILRELAYYSATQRIETTHVKDKKFDAKEALVFLSEILKPGASDAYRMLVAIKKEDGSLSAGHALVPFGYFRDENGHYLVRLYDPNFPQNERRMRIDAEKNTWFYDGTIDSRDPLLYEGTPSNKNVIYFSPVSLRLGTLTPPHVSEGFAVSIRAGIGLISGADNEVGIKDGLVVEKGGLVLPGAANCACSNSNQTLQMLIKKAGLPQTVTLTATGATISGGNVTIQVDDYADNGNSYKTEEVTVGADGKATVNHKFATENDERTVTVTTKNKDGSTTTVVVTTSGNTDSVTVDTNDPNNIKVTGTSKTGSGTSEVKVTVTTTEANGTSKTVTSTSTAGEGRNIDVTAAPKSGTINANNGFPPDSCKNGRRDVNESNTDCGAYCAMKPPQERVGSGRCARYNPCVGNGDCEVGDTCWQRACWEPRCNDNVKNGQESDVDCGGSGCSPCGVGQACVMSSNCGNALLCNNNVCTQATPLSHRLTITGLGPNSRYTLIQLLDGVRTTRVINGNATGAPIEIDLSAAKSLRVSLSEALGNFTCRLDGPRDSVDWPWVWDAPSTGSSMSSRKSYTCNRWSGEVSVPFVINGCQFQRLGTGAQDGGLYIARNDAPKFYDNTVTPPEEMWWIQLYEGQPPFGNYGELRRTIKSSLGGPVPTYDITIGPETTGFYKLQQGSFGGDPASTTRFSMSCLPDAPLRGSLGVGDPTITPRVFCACSTLDAGTPDAGRPDAGPPDAGRPDAGPPDAGPPDAGPPDAGPPDAGPPDAGPPDAGPPDAGPPDAGPPDAGPLVCSNDSQCGTNANCYCANNPGNCAGAGLCLGTKRVFSTPTTNGVASSGSYSVPAGCTRVHVSAWGAAGGKYSAFVPAPLQLAGGAGGFAAGTVSAAPGDVLTVWVGAGGVPNESPVGGEGIGSNAGIAANGGDGDGMESSGGGGLTSVRQTGSTTRTFSVPAGGGAAATGLAEAAGSAMSGGAVGNAGESAMGGSMAGGGGAGSPGGSAGANSFAGKPGAFGTLPSGITSSVGNLGSPPGTTRFDYGLCPSSTAQGMVGGNGCVVVRCAQ